MQATITADRTIFDRAIRAARECDPVIQLTGMPALINADLLGKIEEVWGRIEDALNQAFQYGKEKALMLADDVVGQAQQLLVYAGNQAKEAHQALLKRLSEFTRSILEDLFASIPPTLRIGTFQCALVTVKVSQKLVVTGSLKTNIVDALELAGSGEIQVETEYSLPPS